MSVLIRGVCVFCGSADNISPIYLQAARQMGLLLANQGCTIIYGGGKTGLMGELANGALASGGAVIGIVPESLNYSHLIHANLTGLEVTPDMHTRKMLMHKKSDAFIAMPGGLGTFDEFFETITWMQIGLHQKPVGILNINGYFEPLFRLIDHAIHEKFVYAHHSELFVSSDNPADLFDKMKAFELPDNLDKWVNR